MADTENAHGAVLQAEQHAIVSEKRLVRVKQIDNAPSPLRSDLAAFALLHRHRASFRATKPRGRPRIQSVIMNEGAIR
jgi:hypothetical protein